MRKVLLWSLMCVVGIGIAALANGAEREASMVTGTIVTVDAPTRAFSVANDVGGNVEEMKFLLESSAVVRIHGLKGKLESLKAGDVVTVTYIVKERKNFATTVQHS